MSQSEIQGQAIEEMKMNISSHYNPETGVAYSGKEARRIRRAKERKSFKKR